MSDEDARLAMIAQYDEAIDALQGVAGAESLILDLEKERYKLQQGITQEVEKQSMSEKQRATLAKIDALERDAETGRRRKDQGYYTELQSLYASLLGGLKSDGMFGTDFYMGIEDRLAAMVTQAVGATGYAAASGTGANALIPNVPSSQMYQPTIKVDGRNTNTQQTVINAPINLPPDFVNWFMRSALAQSQRSF
jgi:hypothetical protein